MESSSNPATDTPPDSPMLHGFWYIAALGKAIRRGKLARITMFETRIIVGRDRAGRAFAMRDACPHRGMPLSYGWFDGESVQCGYHGWTFDAVSGQCRFVPSCAEGQPLNVGRIFAPRLECVEQDAYVWVYWPEPAGTIGALSKRAVPPGPPPALPVHSKRYRSFSLTSHVPVAADHALTSLLDPAHGPFVHTRWWWFARLMLSVRPDQGERAVVRDMERDFAPLPFGFRESTSQPITARWFRRQSGAETTTITADYVLPYQRMAEVRAGKYWIAGLATVTPVTRTSSRIELTWAWNIYYFWPFATAIMKFVAWTFFEQDRKAMTRQAEGLVGEPRLMAIDDADRPLRWFYEIKAALFSARKAGRDFENPLKEPVKLRSRATHYGDILR
jgi:phenylpropionate dioxygenase-like ring-hydroxylating dioxygenase large terminal subunit